MDQALVQWILDLAAFDASQLWAEDGYSTCASWLVSKCDLGWSTAKERLRVANELERRPVVREAFAAGALPFSKARVITRLHGVDNERDEKFVAIAGEYSVHVVDARVKNWNYFNDQDRRPGDIDDHYGITRSRGFGGGMGRITIEAPDDQLDRLVGVLDAYLDFLFNNPDEAAKLAMATREPFTEEAPREPSDGEAPQEPSDGEAPQEPSDGEAPREPSARPSLAARRLDALFDLLEEVALVEPTKIDPERATIGVTVAYETLRGTDGWGGTAQGSLLTGEAVRRLACDSGVCRMVVKGASELLDIGRKTRSWPWPMRRAIRARHGHRCAAHGCHRRITQIHHIEHWERDGVTAVHNGVPLCAFHHHLVHEGGWQLTWDVATGVTRLIGPLGQILESEAQLLAAA
ncbi:MAG: hypothetical protein QOJ00_773 [Actinomycetota bacterium]|jgi:hypothetical protein